MAIIHSLSAVAKLILRIESTSDPMLAFYDPNDPVARRNSITMYGIIFPQAHQLWNNRFSGTPYME